MSLPWTDEERAFVIASRMADPERTFASIANGLEYEGYPRRTPEAVRGVFRRYVEDACREVRIETGTALAVELEHKEALDQIHALREEALCGLKRDSVMYQPVPRDGIKVVSISDLHIPFYHEDVIDEIVSLHAEDTDLLVINGDFLELHSVSSWPRSKEVMLRHEYELGSRILRILSDEFKEVVLTRGNHEDRLQRYFTGRIDPGVSFMTHADILDRLAAGYVMNEDGNLVKGSPLPNVQYQKGPTAWFVQVGKCIFAHPAGGSKVPMRLAVREAERFMGQGRDFQAVCIGHTHQMGSIIWNRKLLIEQGCACVPMEYAVNPAGGYRPPSFGYAVVYMDKGGNVDFNKSGPVYCGTGTVVSDSNDYGILD
jgi:predicted phosphodiesterase